MLTNGKLGFNFYFSKKNLRSTDDFIADLDPYEKEIVETLRSIVLTCSPALREKLSYGVPYYSINRRICFVWPASAGAAGIGKGVLLGFCYGNLLSNEQKILEAGERKQVYMITIRSIKDIRPGVFREIIHEAILVDEQFGIRKRR